MVRLTRLLAALATLGATLPVPCALAQAPIPTPAPTPAATAAAQPNCLPGLPRPPDQPASLLQGPPPGPAYACTTPESPYFERDPRLDPPPLPPPGWDVEADVGILVPHVKNKLTDAVQINGGPLDTVHLPSAPLDWTASPRLEVGYQLPSGFGEFALAYRFLATEGTSSVAGPDAPAVLQSRLDLNEADCDYASREISLWPNWDMKWWFGIRGADIFFDSSAAEPFAAAAAGSRIFQTHVANNFWGIGPHCGLELARRLGDSGLAWTVWSDGATLLGRVNQDFSAQSTSGLSGTTRESNPQDVPMVNLFSGLRWCPPSYRYLHLFVGYQYEYWWNVGRLSTTSSRGEVGDQGVQMRAEFHF